VRKAVVAVLLAALVGASCTSAPTTSPRSTGSTPTSATSSTTRPPSALDNLTAFFTAVANIDQRLKAAAAAANGNIGATKITVSKATLDTIAAADPAPAAHDIPAGLAPDVMQPVLRVQRDLLSRFYAFRGFTVLRTEQGEPETILRSDERAAYLMSCLQNGSQPAASFPDDLEAAQTAASHVPPVVAVEPSSRAAADLALWLHYLVLANSGCMMCGDFRVTAVPTINWHHVAPLSSGGNSWDGDMAGILFTAQYTAGQGWAVQINAC